MLRDTKIDRESQEVEAAKAYVTLVGEGLDIAKQQVLNAMQEVEEAKQQISEALKDVQIAKQEVNDTKRQLEIHKNVVIENWTLEHPGITFLELKQCYETGTDVWNHPTCTQLSFRQFVDQEIRELESAVLRKEMSLSGKESILDRKQSVLERKEAILERKEATLERKEDSLNTAKKTLIAAMQKLERVMSNSNSGRSISDFDKFVSFFVNFKGNVLVGELIVFPLCGQFSHISLGSGMFVREDYHILYESIWEHINENPNETRRSIVTGTPGIGKSVFGIFILMKMITERKNVCYCPLKSNIIFFVTFIGDVYTITTNEVGDHKYVALFDGNEFIFDNSIFSTMILFASPFEQHFGEYKKVNCRFFCLDPWSRDELETFSQKANFTQDDWYAKYKLVGGVPRYLFGFLTIESLLKALKGVIPDNKESLETLIRSIEAFSVGDKKTHLLLHLRRSIVNDECYLCYSTQIAEVLIQSKYQLTRRALIRDILKTSDLDLQSWRGKQMEKYFLNCLSFSSIKLRALEDILMMNDARDIDALSYKPLDSEMIESVDNITSTKLYLPISKTFPAIDAVVVLEEQKMILYVQSTVAMVHSIQYSALNSIYSELNGRFTGYSHMLIFLVTQDIYKKIKVQSFLNQDGKVRKTPRNIPIRQFAAQINDNEPDLEAQKLFEKISIK